MTSAIILGMAKPKTKDELEKALVTARSARALLDVQMAGAILEELAAVLAKGDPKKVTVAQLVTMAEVRASRATWQRSVQSMLNGI